MLENLQDRVEQLARVAVLSDAGDLPGLVALQEQAVALAAELGDTQSAPLAELARQIGALAEAIVLQKAPDADAAFTQIGSVIEKMQACTGGGGQSTQPDAGSQKADSEMITAWVGGCDGMLSELEARLLVLERAPEDGEVIAEIRRTMHTLKGECGVLSLHAAQSLCHEAESLIDAHVDGGGGVPIDPFLLLLDWLKAYLTRLSADHTAQPDDHKPVMDAILTAQRSCRKGSAESAPVQGVDAPARVAAQPTPEAAPLARTPVQSDGSPLSFATQPGTEENLGDFICEAKDHIDGSDEALLAQDQDRANTELINTVFRAFHTIKGVSGFMALKPIVSLAHSAEQLLDGARSGSLQLGRGELDLILASCDMMMKLLAVLEGATGPTRGDFDALVRKLDAAAATGGSSPAHPPAAAQAEARAAAQPVIETKPAAAPAGTASSVAGPLNPAGAEVEALGGAKLRKSDQTVKVSTTRMDNLVTMVGELVIAQQMVVQDVAAVAGNGHRVHRTLSHMGKMIRDLQEVSMSLRMVNLKSTFQKMTRLVRDVSQKAGKQIEVVTEGEDVELDRNVVEAITDPLVHMIRNSCDHGVEGVEERRAAGKPASGQVKLRAYHAGGSIVI
ncbi:MAG TPA: Hpt domain-containing protein, partial [Phycisphaerales bacterium]|nr:Hpt domain-containing protein [Phycisphaerales bacterium]